MTKDELYRTYSQWSALLHHWTSICLGRHIDCEFFPDQYKFIVYSGQAQEPELQSWGFKTVPNLARPAGESSITIRLARPEENPSREQLNQDFRRICLAAAQVLNIPLEKTKLIEESMLFLND